MASRRRSPKTESASGTSLPGLPFLAIMLGLMSVMALATMIFSSETVRSDSDSRHVELVGIPEEFEPFYVRCTKDFIFWKEQGSDDWISVSSAELLTILRGPRIMMVSRMTPFLRYLHDQNEKGKKLSFAGKQHSMIIWVEPEGINSLYLTQILISRYDLAIRTGVLPINPEDDVFNGTE